MQIDPLAITQIGPYPVRRFIAQGGMAWVYEVQDPRFEGQNVFRALKMLKPEAAVGEEFLRFRQEAGLLAELDHPNLVTIFDFGKDEATGCSYYVMTYVDGASMSDYIRRDGGLPPDWILPLFLEILSALAELHERGIVHRDIKPANILIGTDNRARLSDLGIARAESSELETRTNIALGTIMFMAPEQARGMRVTPASDVFSVGLTLYHALTGEYVYDQIDGIESTSTLDVLGYLNSLARTGESIDFDFDSSLDIPLPVQAVVKKAVSYEVGDRYENAREMYNALHDALYGEASGRYAIQPEYHPRSRWTLIAGFGAVVAAIAGFGLFQFAYAPWRDASAAHDLADLIRPLRLEVPAVLQRVQEIEGAVSDEIVSSVEGSIGSAQTSWTYAQEDIESSRWESAMSNLNRARNSYEAACTELGNADIAGRAKTALAAFNVEVEALGEVYAELEAMSAPSEAVQRAWGELQSNLAGLNQGAGEGSCAPVIHSVDLIDGINSARTRVSALEQDLTAVAPTIAKKAREAASEARARAVAERVKDRAFDDELNKGDGLLEEGDALVDTAPLRARDVFDKATATFASAAEVVPAVRARAKLRKIEQEIPSGDIDLGVAPRMIGEAAAHFSNGDWSKATQAYNEATRVIASRLGAATQKKEADRLRGEASEYRRAAVRDAADRVTQADFGKAEAAFEAGENAVQSGDLEAAGVRFEEAGRLYRESRSRANTSVQAAQDQKADVKAQVSALMKGRSCSDFESRSARADCDSALVALARGHSALEAFQIADAQRAYTDASRALVRSVDEEAEFMRNKPQPPSIDARTPKSESVAVLRGSPQRLEIEASDPNDGDVLEYRWRFDGTPIASVSGKTYEFTPDRPGEISVTISDKTGKTASASWKISIKNLPPELTVSPRGEISLSRGKSQRYTATAKDPDGTPVATTFRLNGKQVAEGDQYEFNKTAPGTYTLEVVSRDADGGTATAKRVIRVVNRRPELSVTPTRAVEIDAGSNQRFSTTARDPEGTAVSVEYHINGQSVGRGDSYTFARTEPGQYTLDITARDADGAVSSAKREIKVRAGNVVPSAQATWEREVYDTLLKYEAALEAKDMSKLEGVWRFKRSDPLRDFWLSRFRRYSDVSVRLNISPPRKRGSDQATVEFEQIESLDGRGRTYVIQATLLKRAAGWQIIDYDRELKRSR